MKKYTWAAEEGCQDSSALHFIFQEEKHFQYGGAFYSTIF